VREEDVEITHFVAIPCIRSHFRFTRSAEMIDNDTSEFVYEMKEPQVFPWFDYEFIANVLFFLGGVSYVFGSALAYFEEYFLLSSHFNLIGALLYTLQALLCLAAWCDDRHMTVKHSRFRRRRHRKSERERYLRNAVAELQDSLGSSI